VSSTQLGVAQAPGDASVVILPDREYVCIVDYDVCGAKYAVATDASDDRHMHIRISFVAVT
jgi:hypothetical protein